MKNMLRGALTCTSAKRPSRWECALPWGQRLYHQHHAATAIAWQGGDPRMMAELFGGRPATARQRRLDAHRRPRPGILGANGIVVEASGAAGQPLLHATRDGRVCVAFLATGDQPGQFSRNRQHGRLVKLPLIYVCERNLFSEFSYSERYLAEQT